MSVQRDPGCTFECVAGSEEEQLAASAAQRAERLSLWSKYAERKGTFRHRKGFEFLIRGEGQSDVCLGRISTLGSDTHKASCNSHYPFVNVLKYVWILYS